LHNRLVSQTLIGEGEGCKYYESNEPQQAKMGRKPQFQERKQIKAKHMGIRSVMVRTVMQNNLI